MPNPRSSKQVIKTLERKGFVFVAQKGSHAKFRRHGAVLFTVIVPVARKEIPLGTWRSIIRQSGLTEEDFS